MLARDRIARIENLAAQGRIDPATLTALISTRYHGIPAEQLADPRSPAHLRADTSRLARQLANLHTAA